MFNNPYINIIKIFQLIKYKVLKMNMLSKSVLLNKLKNY